MYIFFYFFSPDDGESDDRHLPEQPMTSINNRLKIKGSTSKISIINDFGKAMMYNCEPCGKLLNGAKAKSQHDRLVHSKVLSSRSIYKIPSRVKQSTKNEIALWARIYYILCVYVFLFAKFSFPCHNM